VKVRPIFAWYDLWIGAFWDRGQRRLYILPLPCLGVVIQFKSALPRPCSSCLHRYRWWFRNACQSEAVGIALVVHDAPWRTALCSVQRTGPATKINCGDEGAYWEARG
jgi:hypothetical protein